MSSIASAQYDHSRSRLSSVGLLVFLILATPGVLQSQQRATRGVTQPQATPTPDVSQPQRTGTSDGPPRQDDVPAPRDTTTKRSTRRQDDAPVQRESTFVQRLFAAFLEGLARRDTTSQQPLRMPNVVGMDTATAIRALRVLSRFKLSMPYAIAPPPGTSTPVDRIAEQFPSAGTPLSRGASARFTLAGIPRRPDSVTVPRVIGLLADEAVSTLRTRKLVEERLERRVTAPDSIGRVTGQNPAAGTRLAVGGLVAIAIGQDARVLMPNGTGLTQAVRPPPRPDTLARTVVMPMVVGRDSGTASRILRDAGLRNYRIRVPVNTAAEDTVRAQTPDSGQRVRSGSVVVLTLGARLPPDPDPLPALPVPVLPRPNWFRWLAAVAIALAVAAATALTARTIWPPPQIRPRVRVQPTFTEVVSANGSLVDVSISLRSHVEHERSVLDLTGSPLE